MIFDTTHAIHNTDRWSTDDLVAALGKFRFEYRRFWDPRATGSWRSVAHELTHHLRYGETILIKYPEIDPIICRGLVIINVSCHHGGQNHFLYECYTRQLKSASKNAGSTERHDAIGKYAIAGESVVHAARRGLICKLGSELSSHVELLPETVLRHDDEVTNSQEFPGLKTTQRRFKIEAKLDPKYFIRGGYKMEREKKHSEFLWRSSSEPERFPPVAEPIGFKDLFRRAALTG